MSVKPILFNTEMAQAILGGRKTVTRRALKHPFEVHPNGYITKPRGNERLCPYEPPYQPGDILYVRETWNLNNLREEGNTFELGFIYKAFKDSWKDSFRWVRVSETIYDKYADSMSESNFDSWRPSIHMPKEAARIWLKVTDVRVERLQDISKEQAGKEGVSYATDNSGLMRIAQFIKLWNSTLKGSNLEKYGWNANPWVWVIEFERCEKPEEGA